MSDVVAPLVVLFVCLVVVAAGTAVVLRRRRATSPRPDAVGGPAPTVKEPVRHTVRRPAAEGQRPAPVPVEPLSAATRQRYLTAWEGVQSRFADRPALALSEADAILTRLLADRGLRPDDRSTAGLSPAQASALEGFRAGHAIEQANTSSRCDTEQVRTGMLHFSRVFEALLQDAPAPRSSTPSTHRSRQTR